MARKSVRDMNPEEMQLHLQEKTQEFSRYGLQFFDVDTSCSTRLKYSYTIQGNSHTNTENEIKWMLGILKGKSKSFVESRDEVCRYWRQNQDLLQMAVELGILTPGIADKIKEGEKLTVEQAEYIQSKMY